MREKFSSIERVIGEKNENINDEEKKSVLESAEALFRNQKEFREQLLQTFGSVENIPDKFLKTIFFERKKTPEEVEIIKIINDRTNKLRDRFQLSHLNIPQENIYVIPQEAPWPEDFKGNGYHPPMAQFIVIREKLIEKSYSSKVVFAMRLIHEMIEFKSYASLKKTGESSFDVYRHGLKNYGINKNGKHSFTNLNEAVVEELAIQIFNELKENSLFKEEVDITNQIKNYFAKEQIAEQKKLLDEDIYFIGLDKESSKLHWSGFSNPRERKSLDILIEKIYQKNTDKFKEKKEIFDIFSEAIMTGKIIKLGRLIDQTFGKKTFRKIAENDKDIEAQEKYIDSLK